jgi:enoyl-CoA hydratase/carnithine racemase
VHEAPVPIEPPITRERVARGIASAPRAASVLLDLLRVIETMPVDEALVAESLAYGLLQGSAEHARWLDMRAPVLPQARGRVLLARDGDTLLVTLDHASAGNAIDVAMRDGLREGFELAALDPDIARIELRGLGKAFCVGADLAEFGTTRDPATAHAIRMATLPALAVARCGKPLAIHVQGACVGAGLELAAFAQTLTASRKAWFQLPELAMGLIPGAGGCVSVSRRIGRERTALMVLSGQRMGAEVALRWGLVDRIVDD